MQTTLDMSIVAMICDSAQRTIPSDGDDRGKATSTSGGNATQQRFADVLPVAQSALETPPEEETEVQDTVEDELANVLTKDLPADPRRQGETEPANPEVAGWPFVGAVQPEPVEVAADGQTAAVPSMETEPAFAAGVISSVAQILSQAPVNTELVDASRVNDVAANTMVSAELQIVPIATARDAAPSVLQPGQETSLPVSVGGEQVPSSVRQLPQESTAVDTPQVAQTVRQIMLTEAADVQVDATDGRTQGLPVPQADDPVLQAKGADASDSTFDSQPAVAAKETEQALDGQQPVTTRVSARFEKDVYRQMPPEDDRSIDVSSRSETVSTECTTVEPIQSAVKHVSASTVKDVVATSLQQPVSPGGETATSSQHPVMQTEPQVNADTSVVRSSDQSIGEQILDSIQASAARGDRQVLVRLNPPELGSVLVRFQEQGDLLTGTLEVDNGQTRREIEQVLPQVVRTLQEAGVQVRRLEVVTSDQSDRNMSREHLTQDAWSQRQGDDQNREQSYASPQTRWSQNRPGTGVIRGVGHETRSQTAAAQDGIDLLL